MRVVYLSQFPNMVGGGEYSLLDLMSHLPQDIEPVLVTPSEGVFTDKAKNNNVRHVTLPMPPLKLAKFSTFSQWRKAIKVLKPDILHANNSRAAFYAGVAGKLLGIPVIFHCRVSDHDGFMDTLLQRLVDVIICNSEAVAQRFTDFPKPTHVIYNGLPIAKFPNLANPLPSAEKYMLFVGRITPEKQLEHALEVFGALATHDSNLHFVIVGGAGPEDEGYLQEVKEMFMQKSWFSRVQWLGFCHDVTKWYVHASLLVLTSKHEGFGRVLVEAMAQATPVVAYTVGGVPEVFTDGEQGYLIAPDDKQTMIEVCAKVLSDNDLQQCLGQAGQKQAAKFAIDKHITQMTTVYHDLIETAQ
ncbi:MAG TPA: glycosyltransferase family 1 protein [Mariprofundaceae bacterium]|nr:glycosyltransferase family 1 protein [Mariprofundaceae bacterium]